MAAAYRIESENCVGSSPHTASGAAIDSQLLVTVAHGVPKTGGRITVRDATGATQNADLAYHDEAKDIAVLYLEEPVADHFELGHPTLGKVRLVTYAERDSGPVTEDAEITELIQVTLDGDGKREAARLTGDVNPGDSGAPVLNADGQLVAMVFASTKNSETGWAISATEITAALSTISDGTEQINPPAC